MEIDRRNFIKSSAFFTLALNMGLREAFAQHSAVTYWVSPQGTEEIDHPNAGTASHPINYTYLPFWTERVVPGLAAGDVHVKFISDDGDYNRPLLLENVGHPSNTVILEGEGAGAVVDLTAQTVTPETNLFFKISAAQNLIFRNFRFRGRLISAPRMDDLGQPVDDLFGYALLFTKNCNNILVEQCRWENLANLWYGALGINGAYKQHPCKNITVRDCEWDKVGYFAAAHMMYVSHGVTDIQIINCKLTDCAGSSLKFRDSCNNVRIIGCDFRHTLTFPLGTDDRSAVYRNTPFVQFTTHIDCNPKQPVTGIDRQTCHHLTNENLSLNADMEYLGSHLDNKHQPLNIEIRGNRFYYPEGHWLRNDTAKTKYNPRKNVLELYHEGFDPPKQDGSGYWQYVLQTADRNTMETIEATPENNKIRKSLLLAACGIDTDQITMKDNYYLNQDYTAVFHSRPNYYSHEGGIARDTDTDIRPLIDQNSIALVLPNLALLV